MRNKILYKNELKNLQWVNWSSWSFGNSEVILYIRLYKGRLQYKCDYKSYNKDVRIILRYLHSIKNKLRKEIINYLENDKTNF